MKDEINFHKKIDFVIPLPPLDYNGKITKGMDIANKIANVRTDYSDRPLEVQKMAKVTVETFGVEYPEPEQA